MTHLKQASLISGALWALLGVVSGAFGAHALNDTLLAHNSIAIWKTAVNYQMWHALALLICSTLSIRGALHLPVILLFNLGSLLFSGSLYWLALDGPSWLGPITPLGGTCLLAAWVLFIWAQLRDAG